MACGKGATSQLPQDANATIDPSKIALAYVCENRFRVSNGNPASLDLDWAVENSGDQGSVTLPARASEQVPSETFVTTRAIGTMVLSEAGSRIATAANQQTPCTPQNFPLVTVTVAPQTASLVVGGQQQLSATVSGSSDTAVLWSVQESPSGGFVDANGLYTAPQTPGTFHVIATSHADPKREAIAIVTVLPPLVQVVVTPAALSVQEGASAQLSAQVTGNADSAVLWSVREGAPGGTVAATGLYTAPQTPGTFHVIATSHADPARAAIATITVLPPAVVVTPTAPSVQQGGTVQFSAQVTGTADSVVLWSVREGAAGGTVSATGLYAAPQTPGTFHVIATSHADPTRSTSATVTVKPPPPTAFQVGHWDPPKTWPIVPIEAALLPDSRVIAWSRLGKPNVWDPATDTFLEVPSPSWEFCAGLTFMANGQLIVTGGHISDTFGLPDVNIFDPVASQWIPTTPMAAGRWYPTAIELDDGSILVVAGDKADSTLNTIPEVRNADGTWRELTGADRQIPFFPSLFLAPDGRVFMAGPDRLSLYLDTSGTGRWANGPLSRTSNRDYGAAVMYAPGKIILAGGGDPPTDTAEVVDLRAPSPAWRLTGSMAHARRQVTGTVLPDGKVLVTGGTSGAGFNDESNAVLSAELWDPATDKWSELSSERILRVYHSIALLLPDARVLVGGGGEGAGGTDEPNIEMFSPPYLFNPDGSPATRPTITSAPDSVKGGASFSVSSPDSASIARVTMMRNGALTHTYNTSQNQVPLSFTNNGDGTLTVTAPADPTVAPAGYYMLFLLNAKGVPSVAHIVHLE